MAESQVPYRYTPQSLLELESNLSSPRFGAYLLRAGHHRDYAVQLYLYNARLAKSLLFPLHIMEVALRNGIDCVLTSLFGQEWPSEQAFRTILTVESNNSLQKAINRFKKTVVKKDDLISELSLDFWSNLFRPEYDRQVWQTNMRTLFPGSSLTRAAFQPQIVEINKLRNRIAHHEPILDTNISAIHQRIIEVTSNRSAATGDWVKSHSTVANMLRTKPKAGTLDGPFISDIADRNVTRVTHSATLQDVIDQSATFFVSTNEAGEDQSIFDQADILRFISIRKEGELIDLSEHAVGDLVAELDCMSNFVFFNGNESVSSVSRALKKKVRFVASYDPAQPNRIDGVITKAHRRY
jgi:hypothetical protein